MALTIQPLVILTCRLGSLMWWNDRLDSLRCNPVIKFLSGVASVSNDVLKRETLDQFHRLDEVLALPGRQLQTQRITQTIDCDMNLGREAASRAAQGLCRLVTVFFQHRLHRDEHARWSSQLSHVPYRDHQRNGRAFSPKYLGHTSEQSVCKPCSISHILLVIAAIGHHFDLSKGRLRQNGGIHLHFYRCKHSGLLLESPESLPIDYHLASHLT